MQLWSMLCGSLDVRDILGEMDTRIFTAESLHCSPETIRALIIGYVCMPSHFSHVRFLLTWWTVAHQAPLSKQEYWSGLPCPPPGDLPNPGIESMSLMSPALAGGFLTTSATWERESEVAQSCPTLCDLGSGAYWAPPSMGFSRQEYWSGLSFPSPGDLPDSGIEPRSPAVEADALTSEPAGKPTWEAHVNWLYPDTK